MRGASQSTYRIIVSENQVTLENEEGDLWHFGKINSSNTLNIRYEGDELDSTEKYYWKIKVWDQNGNPVSWSETKHFQMGLLNQDDWQAQWINTPDSTVLGILALCTDQRFGS
jgi:alpha-L-rhamnosidase